MLLDIKVKMSSVRKSALVLVMFAFAGMAFAGGVTYYGSSTVYDTPFTEAGLVNHIPESSTLALLFLVPISLWFNSKRQKQTIKVSKG